MAGSTKTPGAADWRNGVQKRTSQALNEVLWESGRFSDVTFLVGPDEIEVKGHKLILVTRSSVFETMFSSLWTKANEPDGENLVIQVPDAQPDSFRGFLKFLYTDNTDEFVSPIEILYLGQKYDVLELVTVCAAFLLMTISVNTVIHIHQAAKLFGLDDLHAATIKFMIKNGESLISHEDFPKLDLASLLDLFSSDAFQISEVAAFQGILTWAKAECERQEIVPNGQNLRRVAEPLIPLIRFPTMKPQDFVTEVLPTDLLTSSEVIKLFVYFNSHELSKCRNPDLCIPFNAKPRLCNEVSDPGTPSNGNCSVGVYLSSEACSPIGLAYTVTGYMGKIHEESLDFTVDRNIEIIGVGFYGPATDRLRTKNSLKTYMVDIQLLNYRAQNGAETQLKRALVSRTSQSVSTRSDYEVNFIRPITVTKDTLHHVRIAFRGQETQHGVSRLSHVSTLCNGDENVTFNFLGPIPIATNQHQGRIRSLIFKTI